MDYEKMLMDSLKYTLLDDNNQAIITLANILESYFKEIYQKLMPILNPKEITIIVNVLNSYGKKKIPLKKYTLGN